MPLETVSLGNHAALLVTPSGPTRGVALFLHGYDGVLPDAHPPFLAALERHELACLCPQGPGCWWTPTVYPPFDPQLSPLEFLRTTVWNWLSESFPAEEIPFRGVFGVEMGGQGALQLAYRYPRQFSRVAAIGPKVNFEEWHGHGTTLDELFPDREAARQQIATLHINPLDWPRHQLLLCDPADVYCHDGVVTLASKLSSSGVPFEQDLETSHGGYGWTYYDAMAERAIAFLSAAT